MNTGTNDHKQRFNPKVIYRFLGGTALGGLLVSIPLTYGLSTDLNLLQVSVIAFIIMSSGILSCLWGEKFIAAVTQVLDSFAP